MIISCFRKPVSYFIDRKLQRAIMNVPYNKFWAFQRNLLKKSENSGFRLS